jgi:hypothetical protein
MGKPVHLTVCAVCGATFIWDPDTDSAMLGSDEPEPICKRCERDALEGEWFDDEF